jgi:hypothetical protein
LLQVLIAMTTYGYEPIRSGDAVLFYINRDGLPLSDRCNERMWTFCMEQYPKSKFYTSIVLQEIFLFENFSILLL